MDANTDNQQCTCELCQRNWYLGDVEEQFQPQPAVRKESKVDPDSWLRKLCADHEALVLANG